MITTERLILRHRRKTDAGSLYRYAKDDKTGPVAGWPVHARAGNSRELFKRYCRMKKHMGTGHFTYLTKKDWQAQTGNGQA